MPQDKIPYVTVGLNLAVGMGVCVYGGYFLDQKTGGGQIWTLVGTGLGLFYCGYEIWKLLQELNKK